MAKRGLFGGKMAPPFGPKNPGKPFGGGSSAPSVPGVASLSFVRGNPEPPARYPTAPGAKIGNSVSPNPGTVSNQAAMGNPKRAAPKKLFNRHPVSRQPL